MHSVIQGEGLLLKFDQINWNTLWHLTQCFNNSNYIQDITLSPSNSLEFLNGFLEGSIQPSTLKDTHQYNRAMAMRSAYAHMWYTLAHIVGFEFHVISSVDEDYESASFAVIVSSEEYKDRMTNWSLFMHILGFPGLVPEPIWALDDYATEY